METGGQWELDFFFGGGGAKDTIFPMSPPGCNQAMGRNEVSCRKGGNV